MNKEYLPRGKYFWVLFDTSNGDVHSKRYLWWFETREKARDHIKHQKKLKHGASLSQPVKVIIL